MVEVTQIINEFVQEVSKLPLTLWGRTIACSKGLGELCTTRVWNFDESRRKTRLAAMNLASLLSTSIKTGSNRPGATNLAERAQIEVVSAPMDHLNNISQFIAPSAA